MSNAEAWTVKRILEWTTEHLQKHGSESPRLEAEILLAHSRKCDRIQLYTRYDEQLTDAERATMRDLVTRRAKQEPVAYLVGYREFYSLKFKVTPDVLIPRPDTETLVMEALQLSRGVTGARILDVCTGSGCIAISCATNRRDAQVIATDISPAALEVARENAEKHAVSERIEFREGDLLAAVPNFQEQAFDLILSNPPYITTAEMQTLDADVRRYEPHLALDGGEDGLDLVRTLIRQSTSCLKPTGHLLIEIDPAQVESVRLFVQSETEFKTCRFLKDSTGRPRVFHGSLLNPPPTDVTLSEEFDEIPAEEPDEVTSDETDGSMSPQSIQSEPMRDH